MRIDVFGEPGINMQALTYAEYRLFAALTERDESGGVRDARIVLRRVSHGPHSGGVSCLVTVSFEGTPNVRIRTSGSHAYAAINSAIDRLRTGRDLY